MDPSSRTQDIREWLEDRLEQNGHFLFVQLMRYQLLQGNHPNKLEKLKWCQGVVEADIEGRWIVQRDVYVQEEMKALKASLEQSEHDFKQERKKASQLSTYETELKKLHDRYWFHDRRIWKLEAGIPMGSLGRAFRAWRKNPNWYLTPWLRQDCAGRGGCCGRDCGCCEKPRGTSHRSTDHRGHCTSPLVAVVSEAVGSVMMPN
ncbi:hypothetical protein ASPWEDRAFT_441354 [Aspergillus wentii DTO 134E9]|uniref:Uncharacterized protein n=1 Tax=Aspergillus wentii DTO 134E9 TaxID=1073089 RepID=A0A1L9RQE6_ASPWE|nr:uncharacterized protein ASPWEDRAFT_441354 [Aspergillus wentii DTO 134E9]OJJ37149.1 hypothetical protein ASPWEDRAFT_441354 [Aspergillus wentii DTO 134E9]